MNLDPMKIMKVKKAKDTFVENHPKFLLFLGAVKQQALVEGTVMAITVTTPDGRKIESNIKLQASDIEAMNEILG